MRTRPDVLWNCWGCQGRFGTIGTPRRGYRSHPAHLASKKTPTPFFSQTVRNPCGFVANQNSYAGRALRFNDAIHSARRAREFPLDRTREEYFKMDTKTATPKCFATRYCIALEKNLPRVLNFSPQRILPTLLNKHSSALSKTANRGMLAIIELEADACHALPLLTERQKIQTSRSTARAFTRVVVGAFKARKENYALSRSLHSCNRPRRPAPARNPSSTRDGGETCEGGKILPGHEDQCPPYRMVRVSIARMARKSKADCTASRCLNVITNESAAGAKPHGAMVLRFNFRVDRSCKISDAPNTSCMSQMNEKNNKKCKGTEHCLESV